MTALKNKIYSRLKAFTIIEMLFVMMLTAIVTSLTYLYFTQFSLYLKNSTMGDNRYLNFSQFSMVFRTDMDNAAAIHFDGNAVIIATHSDTNITYQIEKRWVIRATDVVEDTFRFRVADLKIQELDLHKGLVKTIEFDAVFDSNNYISYLYLKEYPSLTLFQNYEHTQR
jgi:hypothetical protein